MPNCQNLEMIPFKLKDIGDMGEPHESKVPSPLFQYKRQLFFFNSCISIYYSNESLNKFTISQSLLHHLLLLGLFLDWQRLGTQTRSTTFGVVSSRGRCTFVQREIYTVLSRHSWPLGWNLICYSLKYN